METPTYDVKIGFFVVLGFSAAIALAIAVGAARAHKKTTAYHTYFNEAVTGLDVGSPVKARGVNVGQVGDIAFAPDGTMIEVRMDLLVGTFERFGGAHYDDLRAQLGSQGVTGSKYLSIDLFDPRANPPPLLTFRPREHYIPAVKSQMKSLEDSVIKAMDGLANLVDTMSREGLSEKTVQAMSGIDDVLGSANRFLDGLQRQQLPRRTAIALEKLHMAFDKINAVLDRVDGDAGLIASANRTVGSVGEASRSAPGAARDLDRTLNEIREAAAAVRLFAEELERQPDSLLKGRAQGTSP